MNAAIKSLHPRGANSGDLAQWMRELLSKGALDIPLVGKGRTPARHAALCEFGRQNLSLARVSEAHTDAVAILAEAERVPRPHDLYGVWASDGPDGQLQLIAKSAGNYELRGAKQYCSGSTLLDAALVTAHFGEQLLLVEVPLHTSGLSIDTGRWKSPAFRATVTGTVEFHGVPVRESQIVGTDRWYLDRPGFWHGAFGPAACWAGGALGLVDVAMKARRANPHFLAHLGALEAAAWGLKALLEQAGREIDADPLDTQHAARHRALSARHLIERLCTDVMDHFGRATGPAFLAFDESVAQRFAELTLYIRQCHAERDLQALAE